MIAAISSVLTAAGGTLLGVFSQGNKQAQASFEAEQQRKAAAAAQQRQNELLLELSEDRAETAQYWAIQAPKIAVVLAFGGVVVFLLNKPISTRAKPKTTRKIRSKKK